jgi:hypothetical protein
MKTWQVVLAIVVGIALGAGAMFLWFMFQLADAILN